jgi:uncharacterized protein (TIGR00255 family)
MKSMTGFGYGEFRDDTRQVTLTLKAYNNRFLDLAVFLPPQLAALEQRCRDCLAGKVLRGRVEMSVKVTLTGAGRILPDGEAVLSHVKALRELAAEAGIRERVRLSHLLRLEALFRSEPSPDAEETWQVLHPMLESAFRDFEAMRIREGEHTRGDIARLLQVIAEELRRIESRCPEVEDKIKESLRTRFREVVGDTVEESRLLSETAVILAKADIHEELARLDSHLEHFRAFLEEDGAVGKKLDFLCQEMNREFNTLGAKNILPEVDASVVILKDTLEKIREQLRNVE